VLTQAAMFLAETVIGLFALALLLRFYLQLVRAPYRNPVSQFLCALTDFIVIPARRVIPGLWGMDLATFVLAWFTEVVLLFVLIALRGGELRTTAASLVVGACLLAAIKIIKMSIYILMVAVIVGSTRRDLVEAAYTLGAGPRGIVQRVLLPNAAPQIAETLRLVLGWAWTYVIVAELIGASSGIGHMITDSQALLNTGQIIFGIIMIGLIGLVSDFAFKWANQRMFPWHLVAHS